MDATVMFVMGIGVFAMPFALMLVFNRGNLADSRGRRTNRRWRTHH